MIEPKKKKPTQERTPWPPTDAAQKLEVNLDDDWWKLASRFGRTDPWDIIVYNFNTHDPDEVNWYLYHKIGCRTVTADGKNYRFGAVDLRKPKPAGAPPRLYIYIPPSDWRPATANDDIARNLVLETLLSSQARQVAFTMPTVTVWTGSIGRVGSHVDANRITVRHSPGMARFGGGAHYDGTKNLLEIASVTPNNAVRARIVHEAVHAALDARKALVNKLDEEAAAYVAQCYYLQLVSGPTLPSVNFDWRPICEKAWPIATAKRTRTTTTHTEYEELKAAILGMYPHIRSDPYKHYRHDGV